MFSIEFNLFLKLRWPLLVINYKKIQAMSRPFE